ncbi:hypothetical protein ABT158_23390 [Nonomuraea sp. NPDC001636]|uniref:hypothetical protein n=1 Tax=Nonomuraea sp. NPDC001636 TaxID=3154391 RepID=UPI00332AB869
MEDLVPAAALRPQLAADYHQAEIELNHRFAHRLSAGEILAGLHAARLEQQGDRAVDEAQVNLRKRARAHIAAVRAQAILEKGVRPWSEQEISDRASAHTCKILATARRAVALVAAIPPDELRRLREADHHEGL